MFKCKSKTNIKIESLSSHKIYLLKSFKSIHEKVPRELVFYYIYMRMKVAIVLNTSWNIYNFRISLIKELQGQGHEVHTIAPLDKFTKHLVKQGCIHHNVKMDSRGVNPLKDFALTLELYRIYKSFSPDVILQFTIKPNIYGTIAASRLKIPVINNVCGLGTVFLKKNFVSKIAIRMYKYAFKFPEKIFFQNNDDLQLFIDKKIINIKNTEVLPGSGINLESIIPQDPSAREEERFTFLLISRLIYDKGIIEYIDAVKHLRNIGINAKFQILGSIDPGHARGIPKKIIEGWIKDGIIEYLGTTNNVQDYIHKADCIVLPSYREGTPRTLLEAACAAKPLIATNVPGCNSIVKDMYNGFLCKLKDSTDLAKKMLAMYSLDPQKIRIMGNNSRKKVEGSFDEKIVINKYIETINHF